MSQKSPDARRAGCPAPPQFAARPAGIVLSRGKAHWIVAALALAACDRGPRFRQYEEITQAAPAGDAPSSNVTLAWVTPEGWEERPGSGVRLVAFGVGEAECTVISFPGDAGGVEGNLARWLGQLGLEGTPEQIAALTSSAETVQTTAGATLQVFDFGVVVSPTAATNMLAAILPMEDRTLFVKLQGPRVLLDQHTGAFRALCQSIRRR